MSVLSDFMRKPYSGLTQPGASNLLFTAPQPEWQLTATDATAGGATYPIMRLFNVDQAVGSGGQVLFESKNASAAFVATAVLRGTIDTLTAGAENGRLALSVLKGGAQSFVNLSGVDGAFACGVDGDFALGKTTARWAALYVGDSGGAYKGNLEPDATNTGFAMGSANAVATLIKANGVVIARVVNVGASGAFGFGATANPDGNQQIRITGSHPGPGTTVAGALYDGTVLSTATALATSFRSAPSTQNAGFTLAELAHFYASNAVKGASNTLSLQVGLHVAALSGAASNRALQLDVDAAAGYNVYAGGTGQNYMGGPLTIGSTSQLASFFVNGGAFANTVAARISQGAAGTALQLAFPSSGNGYFLLASDPISSGTPLLYRQDGALMLAAATATAAQLNGALVTINGRLAQAANATFDLTGNTQAVSHIIDGAVSIATGKTFDGMYAAPTLTLVGTALGFGIRANVTVAADAAGTTTVAVLGRVTSAGPGLTKGVQGNAVATAGHTGTMIGGFFSAQAQATTAGSFGVVVEHTGKMNYAIYVQAASAGDQCDNGLFFDNTNLFNNDVIRYVRRATAAANFLRLTDESSVDRFTVDKDGNIVSAALTVFANADVRLGPTGAVTTMAVGFPYMPAAGGAPTGVPTARAGFVPYYYDTTNNKLYVYNGAWKASAALT